MKPERIQDNLLQEYFPHGGPWKFHSQSFLECKLSFPTYGQVLDGVQTLVTIARQHAVEPTFLVEPGELTVRVPWRDGQSEVLRRFAVALVNEGPAA